MRSHDGDASDVQLICIWKSKGVRLDELAQPYIDFVTHIQTLLQTTLTTLHNHILRNLNYIPSSFAGQKGSTLRVPIGVSRPQNIAKQGVIATRRLNGTISKFFQRHPRYLSWLEWRVEL